MKRLLVLCALVSLGCSKSSSTEAQASGGLPASAAPVPSVAAAAPVAKPGGLQQYSGKFSAVRGASTTTKKQGAPAAWEKDDGTQFAGEGELALKVGADGQVEGTLKGALGERSLRGRLEGDELRAQLVPAGENPKEIQNGSLSLKREGAGFKGSLVAATGDSLLLRKAEVSVTASQGS